MFARSTLRTARIVRPARINAFHTTPARRATGINAGEGAADQNAPGKEALKTGARKDPELYVLFAIMTGVFGLAGWHFSRSPTSSSSENAVAKAPGSEPWKSGTTGKYQYYPHGDPNAGRKDAPSALNTVIIPNVNLPKELHDQFNKYGNDDY